MQLPDFDIVAWKQVKKGLDSRRRLCDPGLVSGGDVDPRAVAAARRAFKAGAWSRMEPGTDHIFCP